MNRRQFLGSSLAAAQFSPMSPLPEPAPLGSGFLFLDESRLAASQGAHLVPPPLAKLGLLLSGDLPGDAAGAQSAMGCGLFRIPGGYRLYYSGRSREEPVSGICVAESPDALHWRKPLLGQLKLGGRDTNRIRIEGVPDYAHVTQPSMLQLPDGRFRMYFWLHEYRELKRKRYLVAESRDGLLWKTVNLDRPCLVHLHDPGAATQFKRIRSNDAVHTYALPGGGFEMFSVFPVPNTPATGRYIAHDNAPFMLRVITRRTSEDGLEFSDPEFIAVPDARDPWDQQFYYLTQHRFGPLRIGFLGHYRVQEQSMDIELAYSHDGSRWSRPMRGAWLERGPAGESDSAMVYMPNQLIDAGDHWLALYSGSPALHNQPQQGKRGIHGLKIAKQRFAALASTASVTASLLTKPFYLSGPSLDLNASVSGSLRAELCNAFGQPMEGLSLADSIPVSGDSVHHDLRWKNKSTADHQSQPVSPRLEWRRADLYAIQQSQR